MNAQHDNMLKTAQRFANSIARKSGCGKATKIEFTGFNRIISRSKPGYYKISTGEGPMPNSYMTKFGWKNTVYHHAQTVVSI